MRSSGRRKALPSPFLPSLQEGQRRAAPAEGPLCFLNGTRQGRQKPPAREGPAVSRKRLLLFSLRRVRLQGRPRAPEVSQRRYAASGVQIGTQRRPQQLSGRPLRPAGAVPLGGGGGGSGRAAFRFVLEEGSSLKKFLDDSVPMSPEQRARYLESYEAIRVTHESSAHEGQTESSPRLSSSSIQPEFSHCKMTASPLRRSASLTLIRCNPVACAKATSPVEEAASAPVCLQHWRPTVPLSSLGAPPAAPSIDEKVDLHFIALVNVDGILYELDGRKPFPINHGQSNIDTFLEDAVEVCKKFMERDPDELRFNAIALAAA
ncbi:uncharacterized protein LOC103054308 [Python bivittatus]|uniref:Uncharacterized protein LOC103054308 n=1 Tax=Python bivittatus TaxID=176946 RepID=A0A9F2MXA2_PYTBI|nr:uncharacterized protein LOC103054308 [Python bivittatus]